jgi:glycosyltransferase involved in cell wall biosynthesis
VIVPARDAEATIGRTLDALARQEFGLEFEVIVVDNGSLDATAAVAERARIVSRVIRRSRGQGAGAARNEGAAAARGALLAFLDADCEPSPGWLAAGARAAGSADLVQGRVTPPPDAAIGPYDRTLWVTSAYGLFESANLFVSRELFERVGGFPPGLEDAADAPFGEDVIFGWEARRSGVRTAFCDEALAYHAVFPRGAGSYVREHARRRMFPALAAAVPELREGFLYRRYFLSRRTATFDLAVIGVLGAVFRRDPRALAAAAPYALLSLRHGRRVVLVRAAADAVGALALARGSIAARSPVL